MTVMVRYSLQVTEELDRPLEEMADEAATTKSAEAEMVAKGWIQEGRVWCARLLHQ